MFKLDSVAVHHVCDVGSSAGVSPFIEHDYVSKCVPLPILKRRMIHLFKSYVTILRVSDQKKIQMGYNNRFEILSLNAKKIVPLPRLKRRMIQLLKSLFSFFFISDYDITPIAKIELSSVPSIFTMT